MLELILNLDSNRRGSPRSLLALGLAVALSAVACSEETPNTDGVDSPSTSETDEDKAEPTKPSKSDAGKADAGKPKTDAGVAVKPPVATNRPEATARPHPAEGGEAPPARSGVRSGGALSTARAATTRRHGRRADVGSRMPT